MTQVARYEVFGPKQGHPVTVAHAGEPAGAMTLVVERYAEPFLAKGTWNDHQALVEDTLNAFFRIDGASGKPIVFVDRDDGQREIKAGCETFGTCTRKGKAIRGYDVKVTVGSPRRLEDMLVCGEQLQDIAADLGPATVENPFRVAGFSPALEAQLRQARIRQARQDGKEPDYRSDSGRFFVVEGAGWSAPRTEDPHFHERARAALVRFNAPPGFMAAWDFKEEIWSRPVEGIEAPWGSLHLGALAAGQEEFGRIVMVADKTRNGAQSARRHAALLGDAPLADVLVKMAALTEPGKERLFGYLNGHRADQDGGRGVRWYQDACRAGDEDAMRAPLFLNTEGGGLLYEAARRRTWAPIMDLAKLEYGGKRPGMHLGRHDKITKAVERIMRLPVCDAVKDRMLDDLIDYVGWATGRRMLKVYAASLELIRKARSRLAFVDRHALPVLVGPVPDLEDDDPECLHDLFGDR